MTRIPLDPNGYSVNPSTGTILDPFMGSGTGRLASTISSDTTITP